MLVNFTPIKSEQFYKVWIDSAETDLKKSWGKKENRSETVPNGQFEISQMKFQTAPYNSFLNTLQ